MNGTSGIDYSQPKKWEEIRITYDDGTFTTIYKKDLEKIETIQDVIEGLNKAKALSSEISDLLK